jgi:hypothetical protein
VTYAEALRRVKQLNRAGIWPAIIDNHDGTYRLTYDPEGAQ